MMTPENEKKPTFTTLEKIEITAPIIKFTRDAINWLYAMADIHEHEVGVFGFVDELGNNTYLIRDIFYPKHSEVNGATCEISPEGETMMAEWLMTHGREDDIAKAKFWGHSHVRMGVSPSGQDETQSIERMDRTQSYFIRGIFNKEGKLSISFYDYANKRRFDNLRWQFDENEDVSAIRDKITALKEVNLPKATSTVVTYCPSDNYRGHHMYDDGDEYWKRNFRNSQLNPNSDFNKKSKKGKNKHKNAYEYEFSTK